MLCFDLLYAWEYIRVCLPHFSIHAGSLWSHSTSVFLILVSLWIVTFKDGRFSYYAALPLGLGFLTRPDTAFTIIAFTIYIILYQKENFLKFALLGFSIAIPFFVFSSLEYQTLLPPYYLANRLSGNHFGEALWGNLFSPNRGLFVFSPLFLFSVLGTFYVWWNRKDYDPLYRVICFLPLIHWVTISRFPHWWAGHSYGPRFFALMLPYLLLLLLPALQGIQNITNKPLKISLAGLFALCTVWGGFVQLRGVTQQSVHDWNSYEPNVDLHPEKLWHWDNMQIFASPP